MMPFEQCVAECERLYGKHLDTLPYWMRQSTLEKYAVIMHNKQLSIQFPRRLACSSRMR